MSGSEFERDNIMTDALPATFTRLCDRKKFGMVGVRTVTLSQFQPQTRHRDCSVKLGVGTPKIEGKAVLRGC